MPWSIPESDHLFGGVLWIVTQPRHHAFKRLETDAEFRKRLREEHHLTVSTLMTSEELDDVAWNQCKVQRRIVEDVA